MLPISVDDMARTTLPRPPPFCSFYVSGNMALLLHSYARFRFLVGMLDMAVQFNMNDTGSLRGAINS